MVREEPKVTEVKVARRGNAESRLGCYSVVGSEEFDGDAERLRRILLSKA